MNSNILVMMSKRGRRSDEVGVAAVLQGRRRQMMMGEVLRSLKVEVEVAVVVEEVEVAEMEEGEDEGGDEEGSSFLVILVRSALRNPYSRYRINSPIYHLTSNNEVLCRLP